ncbi:flagellar protein FlaG [Shewanella gelidii]|uniref:Flagella locus protein FlaG n=1 Tax=Shewanella gelidii TaxID=1642821 RepID=A0A917N7K8_9GAMM|nr:flagellar protein FlaG [Shewanella gelidii]MCL1096473.1 flagellar protein FlaG [Shewanella gelidii]GGI67612.1 flagella locus protein FlaG [Shewanella gelidii]
MDINLQGVPHPSITNRVDQKPETKPVAEPTLVGSAKVTEEESVRLVKAVSETEESSKETAKEKRDAEALAEVVEQLSDVVTMMNKGLAFSVDEDSGAAVVKVMDIDSGEIIRQIPSDEALELAQKLQDVKGLLMKTEA